MIDFDIYVICGDDGDDDDGQRLNNRCDLAAVGLWPKRLPPRPPGALLPNV